MSNIKYKIIETLVAEIEKQLKITYPELNLQLKCTYPSDNCAVVVKAMSFYAGQYFGGTITISMPEMMQGKNMGYFRELMVSLVNKIIDQTKKYKPTDASNELPAGLKSKTDSTGYSAQGYITYADLQKAYSYYGEGILGQQAVSSGTMTNKPEKSKKPFKLADIYADMYPEEDAEKPKTWWEGDAMAEAAKVVKESLGKSLPNKVKADDTINKAME